MIDLVVQLLANEPRHFLILLLEFVDCLVALKVVVPYLVLFNARVHHLLQERHITFLFAWLL